MDKKTDKIIEKKKKAAAKAITTLTVFSVFFTILFFTVFRSGASALETGDVNGDGVVDLTDAQLVFDYVAGISALNITELSRADISGDGSVTIADATQLFRYASGVLNSIPFDKTNEKKLLIMKMPDKTEYTVGQKFDTAGMDLSLVYKNGDVIRLGAFSYTIPDSNSVGVKIVIFEYEGMKAAMMITYYPKN